MLKDYSVIISIFSTIISIISLIISWLNHTTDKYKLKKKYNIGITGGNHRIIYLEVANAGKRSVSVSSVKIMLKSGNQMIFPDNQQFYVMPQFPIRLDENSSCSILFDMRHIVKNILLQNEVLKSFVIETQDGKSHTLKITRSKFENMKTFCK